MDLIDQFKEAMKTKLPNVNLYPGNQEKLNTLIISETITDVVNYFNLIDCVPIGIAEAPYPPGLLTGLEIHGENWYAFVMKDIDDEYCWFHLTEFSLFSLMELAFGYKEADKIFEEIFMKGKKDD